jgi:hypothetical protein
MNPMALRLKRVSQGLVQPYAIVASKLGLIYPSQDLYNECGVCTYFLTNACLCFDRAFESKHIAIFRKLIYHLCSPLAKTLPQNSDVDIKRLLEAEQTHPCLHHKCKALLRKLIKIEIFWSFFPMLYLQFQTCTSHAATIVQPYTLPAFTCGLINYHDSPRREDIYM